MLPPDVYTSASRMVLSKFFTRKGDCCALQKNASITVVSVSRRCFMALSCLVEMIGICSVCTFFIGLPEAAFGDCQHKWSLIGAQ
jgi:hypothetical protein